MPYFNFGRDWIFFFLPPTPVFLSVCDYFKSAGLSTSGSRAALSGSHQLPLRSGNAKRREKKREGGKYDAPVIHPQFSGCAQVEAKRRENSRSGLIWWSSQGCSIRARFETKQNFILFQNSHPLYFTFRSCDRIPHKQKRKKKKFDSLKKNAA